MADELGHKSRSSWCRFTIRGLIVFVLLAGFVLGWLAHLRRRARIQRDAIAAIRKAEGTVLYDWQLEGGKTRVIPGTNTIANNVPGWPKPLVDRLGHDYFGHVTQVSFSSLRVGGPRSTPEAVDNALAHVGQLERLETLSVVGVAVSDAGLAHLSGLTDLKSLMLRNCPGWSDAGLVHLEPMVGLKSLFLDHGKVTDAGLAHLRGMSNLETLGLDRADITDAGLAHLESMSRLGHLNLRGTHVGDAGLARLKRLKNLHSLNVQQTDVSDAGLATLSDFPALSGLWLGGPRITDAGMERLQRLARLHTVGLYHADITDAGLEPLLGLTGLRSLDLTGTKVTDRGLERLARLTGLERLFLLDAPPVTPAGVQKLQKALPKLTIAY